MAVCLIFLRPAIDMWGTVVIVVLASFAGAAQASYGRVGRDISWFAYVRDALATSGIFLAFLLSSKVGVWIGFAVGCVILGGFLTSGLRATSEPDERRPAP